MPRFYCVNCGRDFTSVRELTTRTCPNYPNGFCKGNHVLYEGSEKAKYTCKWCGRQFSTIREMTSRTCPEHPNGFCKGNHSPAL